MENQDIKKNINNIISGCLGDHMNIHSSYSLKEKLTIDECVEIINNLNKLLITFRYAIKNVSDLIEDRSL